MRIPFYLLIFIFHLAGLLISSTYSAESSMPPEEQWIQLTKNEDIFTRVKAIETLGNYTTESVITTLIDVMKHDPEFYLREKAAKSLIQIGRPVIDDVIPVIDYPDFEISSLAVWILEAVTGQSHGYDIKKWKQWREKEIKQKTKKGN